MQRAPELSIWDKSHERSIAKKYLHGNFKSGHKTPNEYYLSRAGLRGRKIWLCLSLFLIVYLFALAHLVLTCVILGVLRFDVTGAPYIVFQGDGSTVWPEGATLSNIRLAAPSAIRGYKDKDLTLSGQCGDKMMFGSTQGLPGIAVDDSSVSFISTDPLRVLISHGGDESPTQQMSLSKSTLDIKDLIYANGLRANRITTTAVKKVSEFRSDGKLLMIGVAGVSLGGRQLDILANGNVSIHSQRSTVIGGSRVAMNSLSTSSSSLQHHLCACDNGRLFLMESNALRCAGQDSSSICS